MVVGADTRWRAVVVVVAVVAGMVGLLVPPAGAAEASSDPASNDGPTASDGPQTRIVGGVVARDGEFPSVAALVLKGYSSVDGQFCGATVVDRSWVLTAAQCVRHPDGQWNLKASDIVVHVGTQTLSRGGTRIAAAEVRIHPGWTPRTLRNDLALIRLDQPVPASVPLQTIAPPGTEAANVLDVHVVGWGDTTNHQGVWSDQLRRTYLTRYTQGGCAMEFPRGAFDQATMICAGNDRQGTCDGDSGGPLLFDGVQVGITSWGNRDCGDPPDVFTRVSAYSTWIRWQVRYGAQPDAASYVRRQYLDLFGRQPSSTELFYGVVGLQDGQSPVAFTDGLLRSAAFDSRTGGVVRLYQAVFLRRPETGGLEYWMREVNRGVSLKRIADLVVRAPEFQTLYGSLDDTSFVDLVYDNVLHRAPSEGDRAYWVGELTSGRRSRGQVMVGFSESPEYKSATRPAVAVIGAFGALVRRAPTSGEVATHVGRPSADVTRFLLTSTTYLQRF